MGSRKPIENLSELAPSRRFIIASVEWIQEFDFLLLLNLNDEQQIIFFHQQVLSRRRWGRVFLR